MRLWGAFLFSICHYTFDTSVQYTSLELDMEWPNSPLPTYLSSQIRFIIARSLNYSSWNMIYVTPHLGSKLGPHILLEFGLAQQEWVNPIPTEMDISKKQTDFMMMGTRDCSGPIIYLVECDKKAPWHYQTAITILCGS